MKLWDYYKIFKFTRGSKDLVRKWDLNHNNELVKRVEVLQYQKHSKTYKNLRAFKTPQYNLIYVMRRKKGFNTLFFQQNYDIVITDRTGKILKTFIDQKTGYISEYFSEGHSIFFMVVGQIIHNNFKENDMLNLKFKLLK